jgi:branched-chain amino acid transport system substrate-binding protein
MGRGVLALGRTGAGRNEKQDRRPERRQGFGPIDLGKGAGGWETGDMTVRRLLVLGTLLAGLALSGAAPAAADITVGVAVPRTGPYVAVGEQVLRGVQAAARDANAKGGLDGQTIVLDVQDDSCDSNQAVAVANHYVKSDVRLVVGHVCSNASLAASEVYAANGIVMITAASVAAKLTDRSFPTIFRVCGRDDDQGKLSAAIFRSR